MSMNSSHHQQRLSAASDPLQSPRGFSKADLQAAIDAGNEYRYDRPGSVGSVYSHTVYENRVSYGEQEHERRWSHAEQEQYEREMYYQRARAMSMAHPDLPPRPKPKFVRSSTVNKDMQYHEQGDEQFLDCFETASCPPSALEPGEEALYAAQKHMEEVCERMHRESIRRESIMHEQLMRRQSTSLFENMRRASVARESLRRESMMRESMMRKLSEASVKRTVTPPQEDLETRVDAGSPEMLPTNPNMLSTTAMPSIYNMGFMPLSPGGQNNMFMSLSPGGGNNMFMPLSPGGPNNFVLSPMSAQQFSMFSGPLSPVSTQDMTPPMQPLSMPLLPSPMSPVSYSMPPQQPPMPYNKPPLPPMHTRKPPPPPGPKPANLPTDVSPAEQELTKLKQKFQHMSSIMHEQYKGMMAEGDAKTFNTASGAVTLPKNFSAPKKRKDENDKENYGKRLTCSFVVPEEIQSTKAFRAASYLIGKGGQHMKKIASATDAKLRIRGVNSGHLEGPRMQESLDPLQLCISAPNDESMAKAQEMVKNLFLDMYVAFSKVASSDQSHVDYPITIIDGDIARAEGKE